MTPNDMDILLHHYTTPRVHDRIDAPAVCETIIQFIKDGIMKEDLNCDSGYSVTPKGIFWIDMILETPMPVEGFIDPRTLEKEQ